MSLEEQATATDAVDTDDTKPAAATDEQGGGERDFEAEARQHGWTPKDDFKGDPAKWVDAETFVKRADEVMPFLKKQNAALKREIDDMKREFKRAQKHFSAAEERAYKRAFTDLEKQHEEAVEAGDVAASKRILKEMGDLKPQAADSDDGDGKPDDAQLRRELNEWIEQNDWYVLDDDKRKFADLQASLMGPAMEWEGGNKAYLAELARRVDRKFTDKKPSPTNGGGNREPSKKGGKSYADLPADAKRLCDKWVKSGIIKDREAYVKSYDWS